MILLVIVVLEEVVVTEVVTVAVDRENLVKKTVLKSQHLNFLKLTMRGQPLHQT